MDGIIQYVIFWEWLFSLSILPFRSSRLLCVSVVCFIAAQYSMVGMSICVTICHSNDFSSVGQMTFFSCCFQYFFFVFVFRNLIIKCLGVDSYHSVIKFIDSCLYPLCSAAESFCLASALHFGYWLSGYLKFPLGSSLYLLFLCRDFHFFSFSFFC